MANHHDRRIIRLAMLAGNFLFFYTHVTGLYCFLAYMLPKVYVNYQEPAKSCFGWLLTFFCVESIVFWYFTVTTAKYDRVKGRYGSKLEDVRVANGTHNSLQTERTSGPAHAQLSDGITNRSSWKSEEDKHLIQSESLRSSVSKLTERYRFKSDVSKLLEYASKYLVWHDCAECGRVPPRSFHCSFCGTCVLKRDHHCFVTGVCVGHNNQRHFIVFNLYTAAATLLHFYTAVCYFRLIWDTASRDAEDLKSGNQAHAPRHDAQELARAESQPQQRWTRADFDFEPANFGYLSLFLPVTIFQAFVQRTIPIHLFCVVSHCYLLVYVGVMTVLFTVVEASLVFTGYTMYELKYVFNLRVNEPLTSRVRSVFGPYWYLNLFVPMHFCCKQPADGTQSPALTVSLNRSRDVQAELLQGVEVGSTESSVRLDPVRGMQSFGKVHDV